MHTWTVPAGAEALRRADATLENIHVAPVASPWRRAKWELLDFPGIVRRTRPRVVMQFSNLIFRSLPVPQITVLRSLTFFSAEYAAQSRRGIYQKIRYRIGCWQSRKTIERAAAAFCISQTQKDEIVRAYGSLGEKVRVSHLGIDPPPLVTEDDHLDALPADVRAKINRGVDEDSLLLLSIAHYYQQKNFLTMLRAVDELLRSTPKIRLIITGGLLDYSGPVGEREKAEIALARSLASRKVLVDLGPVPKEWVSPLMRRADLFLFPSSLESFGHPLLEAMSLGTPIVASDTPIHREIAGDAAEYHPTHDPQAMAAAIARVLADSQLRHQMINLGTKRTGNFTWQRHVDDLVAAILEVAR